MRCQSPIGSVLSFLTEFTPLPEVGFSDTLTHSVEADLHPPPFFKEESFEFF